ncbi:MAG: chromophore lyase CpcT/CpeT [Gammaproteobacteria bacterium]|nr:chromophore lyase CpcT/CpeT [Gammaproteobacteria bacterium]
MISLLFCPAIAGNAAGHADLETLMAWMSGDFHNRQQYEAQPPADEPLFGLLGLQRREVEAPALGDHVVYAQINNDADPANVYRQRLYVFELLDGGVIRMSNWGFADPDANKDILGRLEDLASMPRDAFTNSLPETCTSYWTKRDDEFYTYIDPDKCIIESRRGGKLGIQSTEFVSEDRIRNEESGWELDGRMRFGLPEGIYYEYQRTR